jgi:hypothetical protein
MEMEVFGKIDPSSPKEYYEGSINLQGNDIAIDLNFESEEVDESVLKLVSSFLKNAEYMSKKAFSAIATDYDLGEESETARFYLQHHIDEFSKNKLSDIFGEEEINKESFMNSLILQRVGIYAEDDESFVIFDIQFPDEFTNYLMAVTFDDANQLSCISMES